MEGIFKIAWSLIVGLPYNSFPNDFPERTIGCSTEIEDGFNRVERGSTEDFTCFLIISKTSRLVYTSVVLTSTTNLQLAGTTLCCDPASIIVTLIFTGPKNSDCLRSEERRVGKECSERWAS